MDDVDRIQAVRQSNNILWMDLVRLALEVSPTRTRRILAQIAENDAKVQALTRQLSEE